MIIQENLDLQQKQKRDAVNSQFKEAALVVRKELQKKKIWRYPNQGNPTKGADLIKVVVHNSSRSEEMEIVIIVAFQETMPLINKKARM
ncbi:hypothetical protein R1flu_000981 [Riccia fluitans]|uniref:Uncharacterized protein n=1 Tax=Riccia fluitans TaxID=41844 RepID=A0ABD1Y2B7_9MARC